MKPKKCVLILQMYPELNKLSKTYVGTYLGTYAQSDKVKKKSLIRWIGEEYDAV